MTGIWSDRNEEHIYTGDLGEPVFAQPYGDVRQFLHSHGFKQDDATGTPSPSANPGGMQRFENADGRIVHIGVNLSQYGIPEMTTLKGESESSPFDITTIGDLVNFVQLGRQSTAPNRGGEELKSPIDTDGGVSGSVPELEEYMKALRANKTALLRGFTWKAAETAANSGGVAVGAQRATGGQVKIDDGTLEAGRRNPMFGGLTGRMEEWNGQPQPHVQQPLAGGEMQTEERDVLGPGMAPCKCEEVHPGLSHSQWDYANVGTPLPVQKGLDVVIGGITEQSGMTQGPATFCDFCHSAIGTWQDVKGLKACRKCISRMPELRSRFMK